MPITLTAYIQKKQKANKYCQYRTRQQKSQAIKKALFQSCEIQSNRATIAAANQRKRQKSPKTWRGNKQPLNSKHSRRIPSVRFTRTLNTPRRTSYIHRTPHRTNLTPQQSPPYPHSALYPVNPSALWTQHSPVSPTHHPHRLHSPSSLAAIPTNRSKSLCPQKM